LVAHVAYLLYRSLPEPRDHILYLNLSSCLFVTHNTSIIYIIVVYGLIFHFDHFYLYFYVLKYTFWQSWVNNSKVYKIYCNMYSMFLVLSSDKIMYLPYVKHYLIFWLIWPYIDKGCWKTIKWRVLGHIITFETFHTYLFMTTSNSPKIKKNGRAHAHC